MRASVKSGVLVPLLEQGHLSARQLHWAVTSARCQRDGMESAGPPPTGVSLFTACRSGTISSQSRAAVSRSP